ncbi:hypothetical protein F4804DRAFT_350030 [Jackrogersella minutella]|nr:hypothetical protein F4804DRAFT_350030 [Jackrogersella minutella]
MSFFFTGRRLVKILDVLEKQHEFFTYLFNTEQDPFFKTSSIETELCNILRTTVSPDIAVLFVVTPSYASAKKENVWNAIYERIGSPITNPYRFANINSHQHWRLDDQVRRMLSEDVREALPKNFERDDYGLAENLQAGAPNRSPRRLITAHGTTSGRYLYDEILYSPTARAMAGTKERVAEVYHSPAQGELRRPVRFRSNHSRPQKYCNNSKTSSNEDNVCVVDNINTSNLQRSHCSLCGIIKEINAAVAGTRIGVASCRLDRDELNWMPEYAGKRFETLWPLIQRSNVNCQPPGDYRLAWDGLAIHTMNFLELHREEERRAQSTILLHFLRTGALISEARNTYAEDYSILSDLTWDLSSRLAGLNRKDGPQLETSQWEYSLPTPPLFPPWKSKGNGRQTSCDNGSPRPTRDREI